MKLSEELKQSVLQAAIQGKLTEQLPSDGYAYELLNKISVKKDKSLKKIESDEFLFDIPKNWTWARLGEIGETNIGLTYKPSNKSNEGTAVLRSNNIQKGKMDYSNLVKVDMQIPQNKILKKGDLLICARNGSRALVGKTALIDDKGNNMSFGAFMAVYRSNFNPYVYIFLNSYAFRGQLDDAKTTTINQVTQKMIKNQVIPLPPINEQHRIVEKVEQLMSEIDKLEEKENKLEKLKAEFPKDMKASLIQSALEGNLFEDTKNNKKTIDDENLFDIPESWNWKKLKDVLDIKTGLSFRKAEQIEKNNSSIRVLRGGNISTTLSYELKDNDIYVDFETFKSKYIPLKSGDIITPSVTSMENIGKSALIEKDYKNVTAGGFVYIIRVKNKSILSPKYALYFLVSQFHKEMCKPNIRKSGQAFYNLRKTGLIEQPIVLPPLEEQERIVAKLDELLPLCEGLKES